MSRILTFARSTQQTEAMPGVIAIIRSELASQHLQRRYPEITADSSLADDLHTDTLDRICIAVALEEAFSIEISDVALERWQTVGDVMATVAALMQKTAGLGSSSHRSSGQCRP